MLADIKFGSFNSTNVRSTEITEVSYLRALSNKYDTTEIKYLLKYPNVKFHFFYKFIT